MIRLRDVPLRAKLYALVIGYTVLVAGVLTTAVVLLMTYRVHGPVYEQIDQDKRLLNETDPPVLNLGAAYLMLVELETETDPATVQEDLRKFRDFEARYLDRRAYWMSKLPDGEIRRLLEAA